MASILSHRLPPPPPALRIAEAVQATYGTTPALSLVIAAGGLNRTKDARAVAERWHLIQAKGA